MLYYEGMSIADTARGLQIEQKRLYPRIKLLLRLYGKHSKANEFRRTFSRTGFELIASKQNARKDAKSVRP